MGRSVSGKRSRWDHDVPGMPKRIPAERERAIFPLDMCEYRDWTDAYSWSRDLLQDRKFAPYQPGDIVYVSDGPSIKLMRVLTVHAENIDNYIPKYKMQHITTDLYWSGNWKYIYPGFIFRAYHSQDKQPVFRPSFLLESFLSELR